MVPGLRRDSCLEKRLWKGGESHMGRRDTITIPTTTAVAAAADALPPQLSLGGSDNTEPLGKPTSHPQRTVVVRLGSATMDRMTGEGPLGWGMEDKNSRQFGPLLTHEQCYSRVVGDSVQHNVKNGSNTTILVLGPKHSGTNFTLNGGCRVRRSSGGEPMRREGRPDQNAGILPLAVQDLFQTCHTEESSLGGTTMKVYMSYLTVPADGGAARDLLTTRFPKEERIIEDGTVRMKVESTEHVTRLLSKVMERRASDIAQRRTLHVFITFHVIVGEGAFLVESHSSRLTIAKLGTSMNFKQDSLLPASRCGDDDLKSILFELLLDEPTTEHLASCKNEGSCLALERQLDMVLSEAGSKFIIGCVDVASEHGHGTGMLRVLATATDPLFVVNTDSPKGVPDSTNDTGPFFAHTVERSRDTSPQCLTSDNLQNVTKKGNFRRKKLSRDSTIAAVARMSKLLAESKLGHVTVKQGEMSSPRNSNSPRDQISTVDVWRENISLKAYIGRLTAENTEWCREIEALKHQLLDVNTRQQFVATQTTGNLHTSVVSQNQTAICRGLEDVQGIDECGKCEALRACPKTSFYSSEEAEITKPTAAENLDVSHLSVFEESSTESSVFHFGEDHSSVSALSTSSSKHLAPPTAPRVCAAHDVGQAPTPPKDTWIFTNLSSMGYAGGSTSRLLSNCECQKSFLSSGNIENIDFFLPSLNVSCLCGKKQSQTIDHADIQLDALLRPWQSAFLASVGIVDVAHFIATQRDDRERLAKDTMRWRKKKAMKAMPVKACDAALLIWARTCATVVQRFQRNASEEYQTKCSQPPKIHRLNDGATDPWF